MAIEVMAFAVGAILVMTAILGGGFEVKELKVPRVGPLARVGAAVSGIFFVALGMNTGGGDAPAVAAAGLLPAPQPAAPAAANGFLPAQARRLEPASDEWLDQVRAQLAEIDERARQNGLSLSHEVQSGAASEGEDQAIEIELDGGRTYGIMGVCDDDCTDLDLQLLDGEGNVLMEDVEVDAYPALMVEPAATATFYANVRMVSCSQQPCRYGLAIYQR